MNLTYAIAQALKDGREIAVPGADPPYLMKAIAEHGPTAERLLREAVTGLFAEGE